MTRIGIALALAAAAAAQDGSTRENWPHYGGQQSAWRHSALDQITRANIKKLAVKWVFQAGVQDHGLQATPIVVDGVMYITTSWNRVYAIDAETGREIWSYHYAAPKDFGLIYGPWNRGVAVGAGRVFMGTVDNHVVALDQKTGREMWNVEVESMAKCGCNITGAPLLVKDKVVVGVTGGDSAHRGYINAFDVKSGRQAWRFWTIPGPGEPGNDTWLGESWKFGGGSSWITGSFDPELNLVYWGVGNPAADFYGESRRGRNLYTDSVVALDADTGKLKWYHQQIPHDVWDWDTAYECVLVDLPVRGKMRKLLINVNKGGYTFVVDRTNGEFLGAWPVAKNINWVKGIDEQGNLIGRNEPKVGETAVICPSIGGGRSWNHAAYSPRTKLFYTTGIEWCQDLTVQKEEPREGKEFFGGVFKLRPPLEGKAGGHLGAYDPVTGRNVWK
ncbi:MAG: pyrroloquinoline quinone-dependent dehydrogenase, partial [Bryobacteraceae bacterium]